MTHASVHTCPLLFSVMSMCKNQHMHLFGLLVFDASTNWSSMPVLRTGFKKIETEVKSYPQSVSNHRIKNESFYSRLCVGLNLV